LFDGQWRWVSGADTKNSSGDGVVGGRQRGASWVDSSGNISVFGGYGLDASGNTGYLNDLWRFNGATWSRLTGSATADAVGVYGTKGEANANNTPGAREGAAFWVDAANHFYLFGGKGYDHLGNLGFLNDLWRFDGSQWVWVSGSKSRNQSGNYGEKSIPSLSNSPGGRYLSLAWKDDAGNFYLHGGEGYDSGGVSSLLSDLWKFDGVNWTWLSGSNDIDQLGTYGTKGTASSSNVPGARYAATGWVDAHDRLFLFGGYGNDSVNGWGSLGDLWMWDGASAGWTWVSGQSSINLVGSFGTLGIPSSANTPTNIADQAVWKDSGDNVYFWGGDGANGLSNSYWRWIAQVVLDEWTSTAQLGTYGTKGLFLPTFWFKTTPPMEG
jgi:hypothetical protein